MTFFWILESVCTAFKLSTVASEEGGVELLQCLDCWFTFRGWESVQLCFVKINNNMYSDSYLCKACENKNRNWKENNWNVSGWIRGCWCCGLQMRPVIDGGCPWWGHFSHSEPFAVVGQTPASPSRDVKGSVHRDHEIKKRKIYPS